MKFSDIQQVQPVTQITATHIQTMRDLLTAGQRAEVYLYYAQLIGSQNPDAVAQLMEQAQITTYSGSVGGAALVGNFFAKKGACEQSIPYPGKLDDFSVAIVGGLINKIERDIGDSKSGLLSQTDIQATAQNVWDSNQLLPWFPGNFEASFDLLDGDIIPDTNIFLDAGTLFGASPGIVLGMRESDFPSSSYNSVSFQGMTYKINSATGNIAAAFPQSGVYAAFNTLVGDTPSLTSRLVRGQLQRYMGARGQEGTSVFDHYTELCQGDITESQNRLQIQTFFEKVESYSEYLPEPQIKSLSWRDPNIRTFDGIRYSPQDPGEFVYAKSKTDGFEVQTRHSLFRGSNRVSVNTATAVKLTDGTIVEASLPPQGLLCSTENDDAITAPDATTTTVFGGPDNGSAQLTTPGTVTFIDARYNLPSNVFGYYVHNETAPLYGQVIVSAGNDAAAEGRSFTFDEDIPFSNIGYFMVHEGNSATSVNRGLADYANVSFVWERTPNQDYDDYIWSPYLPGGRLSHQNFNLYRHSAIYSNAAFNLNGANRVQDLGNGNFRISGGGTGQWVDYAASTETHLSLNGCDVLTAGPGADTFGYVVGRDGVDTIRQFNPAQDTVLLYDASAYNVHSVSGGTFIDTTPAATSSSRQGILVENVSAAALAPRIATTTATPPSDCTDTTIAPHYTVHADGVPIPLRPGQAKAVGNGLVYRKGNEYTVVTDKGDGVNARVYSEHMKVQTFLSSSREQDSVHGLQGNNDGDRTNDLALPDGTILPQPIPASVLYGTVTRSWCATNPPHQPLLTPSADSVPGCKDPRFSGEYLTLQDFSAQNISNARQQAIALGYDPTSSFFNDILFEILAGGVDVSEDLGVTEEDFIGTEEVQVLNDVTCSTELPPPPGGYPKVKIGTAEADNATLVQDQSYVYAGPGADNVQVVGVDNEIRTGCNDNEVDTVTVVNDREGNPQIRRTHDENLPEFGAEDKLVLDGYCPDDLQIVPAGDAGSVVKVPGRNLWVERVAPPQLERQITFTNPDCGSEVSAGSRLEPLPVWPRLAIPAAMMARDWMGGLLGSSETPAPSSVKIEEIPATTTVDPAIEVNNTPQVETVDDASAIGPTAGVLVPYRPFTPGGSEPGPWAIVSAQEPACQYPDGSLNVVYESGDLPKDALVGPCTLPKPENIFPSSQNLALQHAGAFGGAAVSSALISAVPKALYDIMRANGFSSWSASGAYWAAYGVLLYQSSSSLASLGISTLIRTVARAALSFTEFSDETKLMVTNLADVAVKAALSYSTPLALTSIAGSYAGSVLGSYTEQELMRRCLPSTEEKKVA